MAARCPPLSAFCFPKAALCRSITGVKPKFVPKPAPKPEPGLSPAQRRYFYFTAATTGAAIMIVEILGAKLLAPYVGTSHFVWTAQITITLVALASGYYLGGRWVDRSPRLRSLYLALVGAAVYLCGAALLVERVAYACLGAKLALGSLLAAAVLFFVPLALLATVGPFMVRVLTQSLAGVGSSMGRLTAVSTLGSVVGTILIGYVLIPLLPNSLTLILTAGVLIGVAAIYFLIWGKAGGPQAMVAGALLFAVGCGFASGSKGRFDGANVREVYHANSNFGQVQVLQLQNRPVRLYLNDFLEQGGYDTEAKQGVEMFTYLLHGLAKVYTTNVSDVLCIGLGVGIVPMKFAREGARVDVAEINPAAVPLAQKFFDLDPTRLKITVGDGRQFVNASPKAQYDAIILDAFLGEASPSHLMTREAFTAMRGILRPNGVLVINCFGDFTAGRDFLVTSLQKTLAAAFPSVRIHSGEDAGNVFFVASATELNRWRTPTLDDVHPACRARAETAFARVVGANPEHGIVLTDDYNPVDYHDAANREAVRRNLARNMRDL